MSERLAVVVPVYNEPQIARTLEGLYAQDLTDAHHFIVDNGSTDNTRELINDFSKSRDDFPITVIEEPEKGTGAACDTGFTTAIEAGYELIARTDGDCVPRANWTYRIAEDFSSHRAAQLLGGRLAPLHDEHYRRGDTLLLHGSPPLCATSVLMV